MEPEDSVIQPKEMFASYIVDAKRVEIYEKHKADPEKWSIKNIAQHYGMTIVRAQAIIHLMKIREDTMIKNGVLNIPPEWNDLLYDHLDNPEVTIETLASKHNLELENAKKILNAMLDHHYRKENLNDFNEYVDWSLDLLEVLGVNTSFSEGGQNRIGSNTKYEEKYYPYMFGDDDFDKQRERLRKRLLAETKAKINREKPIKFGRYETKYARWRHMSEDVTSETAQLLQDVNTTDEPPQKMLRWKFAFKELKNKRSGQPPPPTMIRTRSGKLRLANALEEMNRSWSPKPTGLQKILGQERMKKLMDPDQDEAAAKELSHLKRLRREGMLRENGLLKY